MSSDTTSQSSTAKPGDAKKADGAAANGDIPRIKQWKELGLAAFEDAGPEDVERVHRILEDFKKWCENTHQRSPQATKDYVRTMTRNFETNRKSLAVFATEEYIAYGRQKDDFGKPIFSNYALSGMKLFQFYFADVMMESTAHLYNGVAPAVAGKPAVAAVVDSDSTKRGGRAKKQRNEGDQEVTQNSGAAKEEKAEAIESEGAPAKKRKKAAKEPKEPEPAKAAKEPEPAKAAKEPEPAKAAEEPASARAAKEPEQAKESEPEAKGLAVDSEGGAVAKKGKKEKDKTEKKDKKEKAEKKAKKDTPGKEAKPENEKAETEPGRADGEGKVREEDHEEVDLSKFPRSLKVSCSNREGLDGEYFIETAPDGGRPPYKKAALSSDKKEWFLYYSKKKWRIGPKLGSGKCTADIPGVPGVMVPTEPYPHPWHVMVKDVFGNPERKEVLSMRVLDGASAPDIAPRWMMRSSVSNGMAKRLMATRELVVKKEGVPGTDDTKVKTEDGEVKAEAKEEEGENATALAATGAGVKVEAKDVKMEDVKEEDVDEEEEEEEDKQSETSSDSDSSSSSSSSASAEKTPSSARAAISDGDKAKKAMEDMQQNFTEKLRQAIVSLKPRAAHIKLMRVVESVREKVESSGSPFENVTGFTEEGLAELVAKLEKEFGTGLLVDESEPPDGPPPAHLLAKPNDKPARHPSVPPPAHLLQQQSRPPSAPPPRHLLQQARQAQEPPAPREDLPPHRDPGLRPSRSILKHTDRRVKRGRSRRRVEMMADIRGMGLRVEERRVESHRYAGEALWFKQPGSVVECEQCYCVVTQQQGLMCGQYGRPQFAQDQFYCNSCMATASANNYWGHQPQWTEQWHREHWA